MDNFCWINKVFVAESLKEGEHRTGFHLCQDCLYDWEDYKRSRQIQIEYTDISSKTDLFVLLSRILHETQTRGVFPLLHLEMHGDPTGVVLRSKELVLWPELKEAFLAINQATKVNFVVVLAACYGAEILFTLNILEQVPGYCYIAPTEEVISKDIEDGYKAFYNELFTSCNLNNAVQKLNEAFTEKRKNRYVLLDPDYMLFNAFEGTLGISR